MSLCTWTEDCLKIRPMDTKPMAILQLMGFLVSEHRTITPLVDVVFLSKNTPEELKTEDIAPSHHQNLVYFN